MDKKNIAVVGAGISGMSTAYLLMQKGHNVTLYAKAFSPEITSDKAAAFWFPYHIRNDDRGIGWCKISYDYYQQFAQQPATGISMKQLLKVLRTGVQEEEPIWIDFMPTGSYSTLPDDELKEGFSKVYNINVPLIETQIFLPWLQSHLEQNGVNFIQKEISSFDEIKEIHELVINCTALGARKLCNDLSVIPVRGQVALLSPNTSLPIYLDNEEPLYVVPRKDAIIVGGTYEENVEEEVTEPETINRILANAYKALPQLQQQEVIGSWAGLRPYRKEVRVEKDADPKIIHNYGHGGSGFTLAFGCAQTVADIIG